MPGAGPRPPDRSDASPVLATRDNAQLEQLRQLLRMPIRPIPEGGSRDAARPNNAALPCLL